MQYNRAKKDPAPGTESEAGALPCLNSNISNESSEVLASARAGGQALPPLAKLSTQHRKSAFVLKESVHKMCSMYGVENVGFLTLTFREHITKPQEAQRRLNSLLTGVIKPRYRDYIGVMERQKSGRIHYHFLIALNTDIRTGFDFNGIENHDYRSASPALRSEWALWRKAAPAYGFGRTELLPIRSSSEAIAKYVGKYIAKHIEARHLEDKGARLVRYSNGARAGTTRFQFNSPGSANWRRKVATFAEMVQTLNPDRRVACLSDLTAVLGKRWAYHHRDFILALP